MPKSSKKQFKRNIIPNINEEQHKAQKAQRTIQTNLGIITEESNRLARLINDVLDLAKIESGKMTWNMKSLDVSTLFDRAIKSMAGITTNDDIEIILRKNLTLFP